VLAGLVGTKQKYLLGRSSRPEKTIKAIRAQFVEYLTQEKSQFQMVLGLTDKKLNG
jgi:hypothetical protein